jgi:hypothetical protein
MHFKLWDGIWLKELRGFLKRFRPDIVGQYDYVIAAAETRFRSLFGQNWRLEPHFTFTRRHRSAKYYVPWHIDADAVGTVNSTDYSINVWLPLEPVGDLAPSLELLLGSGETMRNIPTQAGSDKSRSDDWVKDNVRGESWIPRAVPGDAIVFDHWILHRTQRIDQENVLRTGCEFRFVRSS